MLVPIKGTLERIFLDKMIETMNNTPPGATYLDFVGTGITEDNIEQIAQNIRNGMFIAENDNELEPDA